METEDKAASPTIWLDADGAPAAVRDVLFRAAERRRIPLVVVANRPLATPRLAWVRLVVVAAGFDVADEHIAAQVAAGDLVVTDDLPLAAAAVDRGAAVLRFRGEPLTPENVRQRLATRDLLDELRGGGVMTAGPPPYGAGDKQRFANAIDRWLTAQTR